MARTKSRICTVSGIKTSEKNFYTNQNHVKAVDNLRRNTGATKEQLKEMYEVLKEMYEQAGNVIDDYLENPSEFSGAVDTDKGLVSGSGIEIHAEAISDNEDDEWELKHL